MNRGFNESLPLLRCETKVTCEGTVAQPYTLLPLGRLG